MKKISDERARVKAMQDETYTRMRSLKSDKYGKTKVWGENRCGGLPSRLPAGMHTYYMLLLRGDHAMLENTERALYC